MADLDRFIKAQEMDYQRALEEVRNGQKQSHWIWYVFPQLTGLGRSEKAEYYAIRDMDEARQYLAHPVLGKRLLEITGALLKLPGSDPGEIFGYPDDLKVRSCMTLFREASPEIEIFQKVLDKYYCGKPDDLTIKILREDN